jgi:hypothetical protein
MLKLLFLVLMLSTAYADTIQGKITRPVSDNVFALDTCNGPVDMDASVAVANEHSVRLTTGTMVTATGTMSGGVFQATAVINHMFACAPGSPYQVSPSRQ